MANFRVFDVGSCIVLPERIVTGFHGDCRRLPTPCDTRCVTSRPSLGNESGMNGGNLRGVPKGTIRVVGLLTAFLKKEVMNAGVIFPLVTRGRLKMGRGREAAAHDKGGRR